MSAAPVGPGSDSVLTLLIKPLLATVISPPGLVFLAAVTFTLVFGVPVLIAAMIEPVDAHRSEIWETLRYILGGWGLGGGASIAQLLVSRSREGGGREPPA